MNTTSASKRRPAADRVVPPMASLDLSSWKFLMVRSFTIPLDWWRPRWTRAYWLGFTLALAGLVIFCVAWPTQLLTNDVPLPIAPITALLTAAPIALARVAPGFSAAVIWCTQLLFIGFFHSYENWPHGWPVVLTIASFVVVPAVAMLSRWWVVALTLVFSPLTFLSWGIDNSVAMDTGSAWAVVLFCTGIGCVIARQLSKSRRMLAEVAEETEVERARRTVLEERAKIARDLHDVVAHHMSNVVVQAQTAPYRAHSEGEIASEFESIANSGRAALNDIRGMLGVLRSDGEAERAPAPGAGEIDELVETLKKAGHCIKATYFGTPDSIGDTVGTVLYRIVQESLSNAIRHAPGAAIEVEIAYGLPTTALVRNAPAVGEPEPSRPGGYGITGMRERASAIGAQLVVGPIPSGGYEVRFVS
jgi:signal transduction histidine kinase